MCVPAPNSTWSPTRREWAKLQTALGLPPDGLPGPRTQEALALVDWRLHDRLRSRYRRCNLEARS